MVKPSEKVVKSKEPVKEPVESSESDASSSDSELEGLPDAEDDRSHKVKKLSKKPAQKQQQNSSQDEYSGIVFVSRLPHGFQEKELSKYFSQFGDLKDARLARNKKTGNTRHYGFIEFVNKDDAKVAQETMNNYLLMGHLIQVRLLPKGSKIEKLYKYRHRSFQFASVKKSSEELKERARKKHDERVNKLKKAGIDFKW
ncbi:hypothetical protein ZYGR_0H02510 [Zygosaccharomyces rouxii]|uniref:ZYRO0B09790p n=2 Tax=Zygosaccharomyces rouxii TaxID=4956 RepID=C5DRN1_ZYGRC|nr:uncharacterized protein ZYRO0B09790g [Zygosaccharomyces rouxii]KAH9200024.1 hypothetical protein LQ764DRAFT_234596 [Zygosaccharomyces rouxii]GAV47409.1 hypothetical protein ZYGR_0H02510 [Zygosaccharomyces rouxii]CAR26442.1 ZYRO0B09790p [Zygosaccharomyces rouxii]